MASTLDIGFWALWPGFGGFILGAKRGVGIQRSLVAEWIHFTLFLGGYIYPI